MQQGSQEVYNKEQKLFSSARFTIVTCLTPLACERNSRVAFPMRVYLGSLTDSKIHRKRGNRGAVRLSYCFQLRGGRLLQSEGCNPLQSMNCSFLPGWGWFCSRTRKNTWPVREPLTHPWPMSPDLRAESALLPQEVTRGRGWFGGPRSGLNGAAL